MAGGGQSRFLDALGRSESKKDSGFRNNWSYESVDESDGDVEKDDVNLLSLEESDGSSSELSAQKSRQVRPGTGRALGDPIRTYERKGKHLHLRPLRGNATGLNMLGGSKKLGDGVQSIAPASGSFVQGRLFHHTSITPTVKTAAQSSLERRERKEYPPHVQKVEADANRVPQRPGIQDTRLHTDGESQPRRKVQQTRRSNLNEYNLPMSPAQLRLSQTESMEQNEPFQCCTSCGKDNRSKTKCQSCVGTQRLYRQNTSLSESPASLSRPSIHQNATVETPVNKGLSTKNFYGSSYSKIPMDSIVKNDVLRWKTSTPNGKVGLSAEAKVTKNTRNRSTRSSEPNDTIILSSDDEDNSSTGSTSRIESISPRPADSACSSPVPSSGKVEAALRENSFIENKFSNPAEFDITIPRKARMKDQFGNSVTNTPVKRRKVSQSDVSNEPLPACFANCESIIVTCRNIRVGTFYRTIADPVVFCLDVIKVQLEAPEDSEDGQLELLLNTSELIKCEWCSVRKLSVMFFQSTASYCQKLRSQFKMSRLKNIVGWYDSKSSNVEEQFIVLILEKALTMEENAFFEKILMEIGVKNSIPNFFSKIVFEEANRRLVAFTKHSEEALPCNSPSTDQVARNVVSETRMKLRNSTTHLQYFDEDEAGDTHNVFVGPIEKLIVYPPPPAKGGISVTNEDLHCLNEGEFLNDVIIDFYLKYLVLEKLRAHADRIHIFSSFFYKRLNQRERRNLQDTANLTLQQRRHGRVKTWTRHVDLFQKDFIFVPLNEAAHWFLAVICFPGFEESKSYPNPYYHAGTLVEDSRTSAISSDSEAFLQCSAAKSTAKKMPNKKQNHTPSDTSSGTDESDASGTRRSHCVGRHTLRRNDQGQQEATAPLKSLFPQTDSNSKIVNGITLECKTPLKHLDGLHRIQMSYSDSPDDLKKNEEEFIDFSDDQDNPDESSDDGGLADDNFTSEAGKWHLKPTICKQPCILLMDSLRGPSRSTVVKTLREYLEVEWEVRKGTKRSFSKEVMKGSNPRVPQQNNFSDCGVYILQYVESFFENPIQSFDLPMNLTDWFPQQRMKRKREEIRNLILSLQEHQSKDKKGQRDLSTTQPTPPEGTEQIINAFAL
ncbi:PREDICTED: sentrin-specific protease 6 [Nanorana parkeri]|uniref:sentrin-specific protease 6 n=1 Tax=Nanorana parkeri TaxID=125878 RepID=UPI000854CDCE|nr:PREDICTED: sentrin-specific protease 6 [Nanorana parkeri]